MLDDMVDTLNADEYGVGLAAPQVGILKRMVVIDVGEGMIELINPVIVETSVLRQVMKHVYQYLALRVLLQDLTMLR